MDMSHRLELARLLEETKRAHTGADDDDHLWVDWYADYLESRIGAYLGGDFDRDTLSAWLAQADAAHRRDAPGSPWPEHYAQFLIEAASGERS